MRKPKQRDKSRASLKALAVLEAGVIVFFVYWMLNEYSFNVFFRNYVDATFGRYFNSLVEITIGAAGLGFSAAWVIITYTHETPASATVKMPKLPSFKLGKKDEVAVPVNPLAAMQMPAPPPPPPPPAKTPMEKLIAAPIEELQVRASKDGLLLNTKPASTDKP